MGNSKSKRYDRFLIKDICNIIFDYVNVNTKKNKIKYYCDNCKEKFINKKIVHATTHINRCLFISKFRKHYFF